VHTLYLLSVYLHILAVCVWMGGMLFLVLVVVPWLRRGERAQAAAFLRETGERFRTVGWVCFGVLIVTGTFNLWAHGVRLSDFARAEWLRSPFGGTLVWKLSTFALVLVLSAFHDFVAGPAATAAIAEDPTSPKTAAARRKASWLGRLNVLLGLMLIACGVMLVRGVPW
jgi:uncharacterized membrane protein